MAYNALPGLTLKPAYISFGLPRSAFGANGGGPLDRPFDAVLDGGARFPDCIWLFRGEDFFRYNVKTGTFEEGPKPLREFSTTLQWPAMFDRVDAATWGGPLYPNLIYFFHGSYWIRTETTWTAPYQPPPFPLTGGWGAAAGDPFTTGVDAAIHGIGEFAGAIHFFKNGYYWRHLLHEGRMEVGPVPIASVFRLPEPFASGIDFVFYGSGDRESQIMYFAKGIDCVRYNLRTRQSEPARRVDFQFPPFAQYIPRPQLFLVEHYALENYVGPHGHGQMVGSPIEVLSGSTDRIRMLVETVATQERATVDTVLNSREESVLTSFYGESRQANQSETETDAYRYKLDASFHGEASAESPWGGEVEAQVGAQGNTDDVRTRVAAATDTAVTSQVTNAERNIVYRTQAASIVYVATERTLFEHIHEIDRHGRPNSKTKYVAITEPYATLLVLKHVQLAYSDGNGTNRLFELDELDTVLSRYIHRHDDIAGPATIRNWVIEQLGAVRDHRGARVNVVRVDEGGNLHFQRDLTSTYSALLPDGSRDSIVTEGVVVRASYRLIGKTEIDSITTEWSSAEEVHR